MGIFNKITSKELSVRHKSSSDGYFSVFEEGGGNEEGKGSLNDSGHQDQNLNMSLNQSLIRKSTVDMEKTEKALENYYQSLLNDSVNRAESLDLFLLLDQENDQFLKYNEIECLWPTIEKLNELDRGNLTSQEEFKEKFESFGKYQMDSTTFNQFIDSTEVNVQKIRDIVYNDAFKGCCTKIFCACCKPCHRKIRASMIKGQMKKQDDLIRMVVYDEEPKTTRMQDMIALIMAIIQAKSEIAHHITDILLCSKTYWTGMQQDNKDLWSYKFATVFIFMSITSVYLIAYSSMINMLLFKGVYEPQQIKRNSYLQVFNKIIFLSFLGPIYFVGVEIISKIMAVCATLGMILRGKSGYQWVRVRFLRLIDYLFNLNEEQIDGLNKQRGVVQLLFESLPMVILQILIRYEFVPCHDLQTESRLVLFISLIACLINVFVNTFMIYTESKSLTEPFLEYVLNSFKARQGWIPFMLQIERKELKQAVDYGDVKCSYPVVTGQTAVYKVFKFQFSDTSLQVLTSALVKWDTTTTEEVDLVLDDSDEDLDFYGQRKNKKKSKLAKVKYIMDLGTSLTYVSVNTLLHFYHLSPRHRIFIKLSHLNWNELITNAKKSYLIYKPSDSTLMQARTPSGIHLLWICVEDEKKANMSSSQLYELQYGILRRYKIINHALNYLSDYKPELGQQNNTLKKFQEWMDGGTFEYIEEHVKDMLICKNKNVLADLTRVVQRANKILNKCQDMIILYDNFNSDQILQKIESIKYEMSSFLQRMDEATLKLDEIAVIIEDQMSMQELTERWKEPFTQLRDKCDGVQNRFKTNKTKVKDKLTQILNDLDQAHNLYTLTHAGAKAKQLLQMMYELEVQAGNDPVKIKKDLVNLLIDMRRQQKSNQDDNKDEKPEVFTYTANKDDPVDVLFEECYKKSEGGHHPVKFIKKDEDNQEWRYYEYYGKEIIFEAYNGAKRLGDCYILCRNLGIDDNDHNYAFEKIRNETNKKQLLDSLKKPGVINLVKASLKFKVENTQIQSMIDKINEKLEQKKTMNLDSLRFRDLLKMDLIKDFDDFYEKYESLLPPVEELTVFAMDEVPDFIDPNSWVLNKCMDFLVNKEQCDPNIMDNYGEKLLNFAIKSNKQLSIDIILQSNNANVNEPNKQGISPIGQAFISRNVHAIRRLLDYRADLHANCVIDPKYTRKFITPLHYFIKRIRLGAEDSLDEQIMTILIENGIKAKNEDEKIGIIKQLCRMYATKEFQRDPTDVIKKFILPLLEEGDLNLLEFKDRKQNNALHIFIKGKVEDEFRFINKQMYSYTPESLSHDEKKAGFNKLLLSKNTYENESYSPLELVYINRDRKNIKVLCEGLVDKFDEAQTNLCLQYIIAEAHVNYDHFFFRGPKLNDIAKPLYKYIPGTQQEIKDLIFEFANKNGKPNQRVLYNLYQQLQIGPEVPKLHTMGQSEPRNYQRDESKELQVITISKVDGQDQSKVGEFVRYFKDKSNMNQLANLMMKDLSSKLIDASISKKLVKEKQPNPYFEFVFTLILELIALFDMFGDIYLMYSMYIYGHTAWFTLSIFTMLSPFYVCYVPLVTFQKNRGKLQKETRFLKMLNIVSLTPLIVAYLLIMDIIYILVSVVITPTAMFIKLLSCGLIDVTNVEEKLDVLYEILFGMSDMDIKGFRRLRTISQLSFESLPQIILQSRILIYAFNGDNQLGVSLEAILASLACALLHAIFEMIFVYLEAYSCKTTVIHYFIVCFNARFGWIPFVNFFSSLAGFDEDAENQAENLNYEGMKSQFCGIQFQMHFRFSNSSCATLINALSNLREEKDPKKRMQLKIGESLNDVDFPLIFDLMIISNRRINLEISEVNLLTLIKNDEATMKELTTKKTEQEEAQQEYLIQRVAKLGQSSVIETMLQIDNLFLDFKPTLLDIAQTTDNYDIAKLVINSNGFDQKLMQVDDNLSYLYNLIQLHNPIIQASLFSNPNIIIPEQFQGLILQQIVHYLIQKDFRNGLKLYHLVFGTMNPDYLMRGVGDLETTRAASYLQMKEAFLQVKPFIDDQVNKLPKQFFFFTSKNMKQNDENLQVYSIATEIASCFSMLRDRAIRHWDIEDFQMDAVGTINDPFDLHEFHIDPKTLINVAKLLTKDHKLITSMSLTEVKKCDKVVQVLGLDKYRSTYWYRSRQGDQTQSLFNIKIDQECKLSLDEENVARKDWFKSTVVIVKERFNGATHKSFEYKLPDEVLAVRKFSIQFDYYGGSVQLNHLSRFHQSSFEISDENMNNWVSQLYVEQFSEESEDMKGFKDIISSATGGDTIQLWLQTNGYAFSKNIVAEFQVILKDGASIQLTPKKVEEKQEEKKDDDKEKENKDAE